MKLVQAHKLVHNGNENIKKHKKITHIWYIPQGRHSLVGYLRKQNRIFSKNTVIDIIEGGKIKHVSLTVTSSSLFSRKTGQSRKSGTKGSFKKKIYTYIFNWKLYTNGVLPI